METPCVSLAQERVPVPVAPPLPAACIVHPRVRLKHSPCRQRPTRSFPTDPVRKLRTAVTWCWCIHITNLAVRIPHAHVRTYAIQPQDQLAPSVQTTGHSPKTAGRFSNLVVLATLKHEGWLCGAAAAYTVVCTVNGTSQHTHPGPSSTHDSAHRVSPPPHARKNPIRREFRRTVLPRRE